MWLKIIIFCLLQYISAEEVGEECVPSEDVDDGLCTLVTECEVAKRSIMETRTHNLKRCSWYNNNMEVVCCPVTSDKFGSQTTTTEQSRHVTSSTQRIADRECKKIVDSAIPPLGQYILGGEVAALGEFPHMAALGYDRGNEIVFNCGGTLISRTFVLTAAHCVDNIERIAPTFVRVGTVELGGNTVNANTDISIAEIRKHPKYTNAQKYHDICLLRLSRPVTLSATLNPACLYTKEALPTIPMTLTGWGTTNVATDTRSSVLLKANVSIIPTQECQEPYEMWRKLPGGISGDQFCAKDNEGRGRDSCQGDSGGPMQGLTASDGWYRVVGVTSFGRGCGTVAGVYTRVSHYLDWIEGEVWPQ